LEVSDFVFLWGMVLLFIVVFLCVVLHVCFIIFRLFPEHVFHVFPTCFNRGAVSSFHCWWFDDKTGICLLHPWIQDFPQKCLNPGFLGCVKQGNLFLLLVLDYTPHFELPDRYLSSIVFTY
jgi:hypothetical protein